MQTNDAVSTRILLRDKRDGRYWTGPATWVSDPAEAMNFDTIAEASLFAALETPVEVEVVFDALGWFEALPPSLPPGATISLGHSSRRPRQLETSAATDSEAEVVQALRTLLLDSAPGDPPKTNR